MHDVYPAEFVLLILDAFYKFTAADQKLAQAGLIISDPRSLDGDGQAVSLSPRR